MIKKTFKELVEIDSIVGTLYAKNKELRNSKFGYAYKKFSEKSYYPNLEKYREELQYARIDNALEDEKTKEILVDQTNIRGFKYSKEGLKAVIKRENEISEEWDKKEFEVEPVEFKGKYPEMDEEQKEKLSSILIPTK